MNPFEPGGPQIPPIPIDIPTPDIPQADFISIGKQLEEGRQAAAQGLTLTQNFLNWLAAVVGAIIGTILGWVERIIAWLIGIWFKVFQNAEPGTDAVTQAAVQGMFGRPVSSGLWVNPFNYSGRQGEIHSLAQYVINALFPAVPGGAGGHLQPGHEGADNFVDISMRVAIEGWLQGWLMELASVGFLERFGDLKDIVERTLGLGRLMRRVLAAPLRILLEDPFTWELNNLYRPRLPGQGEAIRMYIRGRIDLPTMQRYLAWQGYTDEMIANAVLDERPHLSPAEIEEAVYLGVMDQSGALGFMKELGYDDVLGPLILQINQAQRYEAIRMENARAVVEEYAAFRISDLDLQTLIQQGVKDPVIQQLLIAQAEFKRQARAPRITLAEMEFAVVQGVATISDYSDLALSYGYTPANVLTLETILLVKLNQHAQAIAKQQAAAKAKADAAAAKAAAAKAKAAAAALAAETKGLSLAKYQALVKEGLKTIADYQTYLQDRNVAPDNVTALVTELQNELNAAAGKGSAGSGASSKAKAKVASLAQLEAAVENGLMTLDAFEQRLLAEGIDQADVTLISGVLQDKIAQKAALAAAKAAAAAAKAIKHVNDAQEVKAVRLGLATITDYQAFLTAHGFAPEDEALLVGELQAQLQTDATARANKAAAATAKTDKGVPIAQLERLVRAGQASLSDYTNAVMAAGYSAAAAAQMTDLLKLQMQQDQETFAANGKATALLGQRGVSLTELASAVELGIVPMSVYTAQLAAAGLSATDQQTLTLALAAKIKKAAATKGKTPSISQQLAQKGYSLSALETAVKKGELQQGQFDSILTGAGVDATDLADLDALLAEEIANEQALAALKASATAKAKAKGISLSQEDAAVKAGLKTLDQYYTFVVSLGFSPTDAYLLEAILAVNTLKQAPPPPPPGVAPLPAP